MSAIVQIYGSADENSDFWVVAAIGVDRPTFSQPVLLAPSDVSGPITLSLYEQHSATPIYTTTFLKTLVQAPATEAAVHTALVDSRWGGLDTIGHNVTYKIRMADLAPVVLKGGRTYDLEFSIPTGSDGIIRAAAHATIRAFHG